MMKMYLHVVILFEIKIRKENNVPHIRIGGCILLSMYHYIVTTVAGQIRIMHSFFRQFIHFELLDSTFF